MATKQEIRLLISNLTGNKVPTQYATINDLEDLVREELRKLAGNYNLFRRNKLDIYELIQTTVDEVLPRRVNDAIGIFAETRQYKQGDKPVFKVRLGKQRAKQFITRVGMNGTYETFRLDNGEFTVEMGAHGGATYVDFERYLDGHETLMELYQIIVDGLMDVIYTLIQEAMIKSWDSQGRPAVNKATSAGFDAKAMRELCNVVSAYGAPAIYCGPQFAGEMSNIVPITSGGVAANPNLPQQDLADIRDRGYIGKFFGVPIVVMPNSFTDETNAHAVFNPRLAYVIPTGVDKPVKIAMEGETIVDDYKNKGDRSMEIQASKRLGVGIIAGEHTWGIYQNTAITDADWPLLT